jgi:hypothetical protein
MEAQYGAMNVQHALHNSITTLSVQKYLTSTVKFNQYKCLYEVWKLQNKKQYNTVQ